MKKYFVELIGTFYLVLTVLCVVLMGDSKTIPALAIGSVLMVMVYAGGHISGGHYNPAVSLAAAIRGTLSFRELIQYWVSQILGAILASVVIMQFIPNIGPCPENTFHHTNLGVAEFLFTFALCYVVLLCATTQATKGNSYYGLAIGSTVTVGIFAVGGICLAAFNPAVAIGLWIMHVAAPEIILLTIAVNLVAGAIAAGMFELVSDEA